MELANQLINFIYNRLYRLYFFLIGITQHLPK